jgi:hypothetical protein
MRFAKQHSSTLRNERSAANPDAKIARSGNAVITDEPAAARTWSRFR